MRDFLFSVISFSCGHRSGVSAHLTVEEFYNNNGPTNDGYVKIGVKDHKTYYCYGPAYIVLTAIEYEWLKAFVEKARPCTNPKCNKVFLSWSGNKMESGQVSIVEFLTLLVVCEAFIWAIVKVPVLMFSNSHESWQSNEGKANL